MSQVVELPLDRLYVGNMNVRKELGDISDLVESIKQVGILEPLITRSVEGKYEVIVGNRRYNAAKKVGLHTIPCIVKEMDDDEAILTSLTENIQRGDISEEETAIAYTLLNKIDPKRWTQERISKRIGKSQQWLSDILMAYRTSVKLQQMGLIRGWKAHPREEEREEGIAPLAHLKEIEYAMRSEEVRKKLSEKEQEEKRVDLAREVLDLPIVDAKQVIDRFKMYPEKPVEEIKEEALARKTGVALETYLPPRVARDLDRLAEERKTSIEEILPDVVERGLKVQMEERERVEVPAKMIDEVEVGEIECPKCRALLRLIHCEPGKAHKIERKAV